MEGKWHQWKGAAKVQWGKLTDDDRDLINGNVEQLAGEIPEPPDSAGPRRLR
jgi:uncharacterized protein YjbJ (UPF0337 family)